MHTKDTPESGPNCGSSAAQEMLARKDPKNEKNDIPLAKRKMKAQWDLKSQMGKGNACTLWTCLHVVLQNKLFNLD